MLNSYRIRTQVGVDKSIKVQLDQDFEQLEILSLKILQSQVYNRICSDYGVVVGRITANAGFGLPNCKVSVFIPISDEDSNKENISTLYPYKTLNDLNEDGYRYNLLPYTQSHGGHTPTGTFPTRNDVLTDPTLIEIYDKYYKLTTKTNASGDFMIFGVPVGSQTIHVDIDLSDIGEFSLSPQDLIRLNIATENQVNGTTFKSSTNLGELPQLLTINRTIEVEPFWGQPEVCNLGITRTDFDLTQEFGLTIAPAAIFMGSLISNSDEKMVKRNCRVQRKMGNLCNLVAGPGEILAIRQTINIDSNGRPVLEQYKLENGGKCIDENGTWLIDVPMNLDYVFTNEFGEREISNDPKVGIPTRGKYRFKIKWEQPQTVSGPIKRGIFLVPNIKEWGWVNPADDPSYADNFNYKGCKKLTSNDLLDSNYLQVQSSYAFSLDWDDYGRGSNSNQMIQEAIDCEDRFYDMKYNKVYTVSQLISEYRPKAGQKDYIGIKDIMDETCESTNNKFPANDGQKQTDIVYLLFILLIYILTPVVYSLVIVSHLISLIICILAGIVWIFKTVICGLRDGICAIVNLEILGVSPFGFLGFLCDILNSACQPLEEAYNTLNNWCKNFSINLPMLTYPDCEMCDCDAEGPQEVPSESPASSVSASLVASSVGSGQLSNMFSTGNYNCGAENSGKFAQLQTGYYLNTTTPTRRTRAPQLVEFQTDTKYIFTSSLPLFEKLNVFNTKSKYFNNNAGSGNMGGGWNRIKVSFNTDSNNPDSKWHLDNILVLMVSDQNSNQYNQGDIVTFINNTNTLDPNLNNLTSQNQFGTNSITGTTLGTPVYDVNGNLLYYTRTITVPYSNPDGTGNFVGSNNSNIVITASTADTSYARFAMDNEYFQVIKSTTVSEFLSLSSFSHYDSFPTRVLSSGMKGFYLSSCSTNGVNLNANTSSIGTNINNECLNNFTSQKLIFLVRGVDPNSSRTKCQFDLSRLYGYDTNFATSWAANLQHIVTGDFKLNIPIQGGLKNVKHNGITNNGSIDVYSTSRLFYDSYSFSIDSTLFQTFTTSATTLYSNFDNTVELAPYESTFYNAQYYDTSSGGAKVSPTNLFSRELYFPIPFGECVFYMFDTYTGGYANPIASGTIENQYNTINNNRNRGYYYNEIIEGGGLMGMTGNLGMVPVGFFPPTVTPDNYEASMPSAYFCQRYRPIDDQLTISDSQKIVMRSDRLPMSSSPQDNGTLSSFPLHANQNFMIYKVSDDGSVTVNITNTATSSSYTQDNIENINEVTAFAGFSNTFSCDGLIPLGCYDVADDGTVTVKPSDDNCYTNRVNNEHIVDNGCYKLVTIPILTLPLDLYLVQEWAFRMKVAFAACKNVFGHIFTNNWINGTLFMFPFENETRYTEPTDTPPNDAYACVCKHLIFFDQSTKNFFYRCAPYDPNVGYIGRNNPIGGIGQDLLGNQRDLMFPTTIMDLGPRNDYMSQLTFSGEYEGYIANKLTTTSYQDVSELLNLFLISRQVSTSFIGVILQANSGVFSDPVAKFFSRPNQKIDGDYAQMVAINSQLGVRSFDPLVYGNVGEIFFLPANSYKVVFGIFYKSDLQIRDWITPHRLIVSETVEANSNCAFENSPIFSQDVPHYHWRVDDFGSSNSDLNSIFGTDENEWFTEPLSNGSFYHWGYQALDRTSGNLSDYFQPGDISQTNFSKGYIYGVLNNSIDGYVNNGGGIPPGNSDREFTVGAPFYFFFGLNRGKSAFDRFLHKWVSADVNVI